MERGQILYQAWLDCQEDTDEEPGWGELTQTQRDVWTATAQAYDRLAWGRGV